MSGLWVPAASPLFLYSPSSLIAANLQGKWTGILSQGPVGAGNHTAATLQQSGAVLFPSVYSKGFTPVFSPQTGWSVSLAVNSEPPQPWAPGQVWQGQQLDPNTFLLSFECTAGDCSSTPITFGGATISTDFVSGGGTPAYAFLDDGAHGASYTGDFTGISSGGNATVGITSQDSEGTLSWTGTAGAAASVTFQGYAIAVYGVTGPSLGNFGITVDGNRVSTLSARSDVEAHGVLLYYTTNLDPSGSHTMILEALDGGNEGQVGLVIDRWQAWGPEGGTSFSTASTTTGQAVQTTQPLGPAIIPISPTTTPVPASGPINNGTSPPPEGAAVDNSGPNTGAIVGGIIGGLAALGLLYFMFRKVHQAMKPDEKKTSPWDDANMLQNVKNEGVHVTTVANQRYVYPGMISHSKLKD